MTSRRFLFQAAGLGLALSLAGCKPAEPAGPPAVKPVFLLSARLDRPFDLARQQLFIRLLANASPLQARVRDAAGRVEAQRQQLLEAVAAGAFAVLLEPVQPEALQKELQAAVAAGVLLVGLGEQARPLQGATLVSCNQREIGRLAGELTLRALTLKAREAGAAVPAGRVVEIRGDEDSPECQQRHEGFSAALAQAAGVVQVHDAPGHWTKQGGHDRAQDALRLQQTFDVVYAHSDIMALGAAEALRDRREQVMIIGTNGQRGREGGMTLVGNGDLDASVHQPLLIDFVWTLLQRRLQEPGFQPKPSYELPPQLITPKDVDDIRRNGLASFPEL